MKKVLIIGATSAIAQETAKLYAKEKAALFLVGRDESKLKAIEDDLKTRGAEQVISYTTDLNEFHKHQGLIDEAQDILGDIDVVLIAHGTLGKQEEFEKDFEKTHRSFKTNFISVASLVTILANHLEGKQKGSIAVISSVAGDRGRGSNYVYGTSKAAVSIFLAGVRNRLAKKGVQVLTIKPGFVDTPMTAEFKKGLLWARPDTIARGIVKAIDRKKDVVYLPGFWRLIMFIIRHIPERIFKKLSM
jgi:short-subunit dehydrogenase